MKFTNLGIYKNFCEYIERHINNRSSFIVLSLPGVGASFFAKTYVENLPKENISYISDENQKIVNFNILDFNIDMDPEALKKIDNIVENSRTDQKFAVVINTPSFTESEEFANSFLGRHIYDTFYLGLQEFEVVEELSERLGAKLNTKELTAVWHLTGGIGRWTKYILNHKELLQHSDDNLLNDDLVRLIKPTLVQINNTSDRLKEKLRIIGSEKIRCDLLNLYTNHHPLDQISVSVGPDLKLVENGQEGEKLLKVEAEIVKYMISNKFVIEKEKVADFKWGRDSYDEYSDQAIGKTMRRLDKKFCLHQIETIPNYGFVLKREGNG